MADKLDLYCDQGNPFTTQFQVTDGVNQVNTAGYSTVSPAYFKYSINQNTYSGQITSTIDTNTSIITLTVAANQTSNIATGRYFYDVMVLDDTNTAIKIVEGLLVINPSISNIITQGSEDPVLT